MCNLNFLSISSLNMLLQFKQQLYNVIHMSLVVTCIPLADYFYTELNARLFVEAERPAYFGLLPQASNLL